MNEQIIEKIQPIIGLFGQSPWLKALMVLLLSLVLASAVQWFVNRGIRRLAATTATSLDDQIIHLIHRPIFWTVMLLGLQIASQIAGLPDKVLQITASSVFSILIFLWMVFAFKASRIFIGLLSRYSRDTSLIRPQTLPLFTNLAAIAIIVFGVYFVFNAWHVDMTAWLASAGIAGIAIGPFGLDFLGDAGQDIMHFAEFGVVLMLFLIVALPGLAVAEVAAVVVGGSVGVPGLDETARAAAACPA